MNTKHLIFIGIGVLLLTVGGKYVASKIRGVRNNNPGNIKKSSIVWQGMSPVQDDNTFVKFVTPEAGFRALAMNLKSYFKKGFNTVEKIISRWAPASENVTHKYVEHVAALLGVKPTQVLTPDENTLFKLCLAIARHEIGFNPYSDATVLKGVRAAV
jgi:hypothetical protein